MGQKLSDFQLYILKIDKLNKSYSLHKITSKSNLTFNPSDYSWFKFGDKYFEEIFKPYMVEKLESSSKEYSNTYEIIDQSE